MQIDGNIVVIEEEVQVKEYRRRKFVIEHSDCGNIQYLSFELIQSHCNILDSFNLGDEVIIDFNLNGRKWIDKEGEEKYWNTLQAWKITKKEK
jgi:hypothetical protein